MSGYLVPINKSAKSRATKVGVTSAVGAAARTPKGRVTQAKVTAAVKDAINRAKTTADVPTSAAHAPAAHVPAAPGTPYNKISERSMRLANPGLIAGGAGVLAAGGGGAYLYRRKRAEKSLSSMQRD